MNQTPRIWVHHEWDRLCEAIVGRSENVVVAEWNEGYHRTFGAEVNDWYRTHGGRRLDSFDPQLAARMIAQQDHLAELLEAAGVTVHRVSLLTDSADQTILTPLAEGMFSFPRDPIAVIGSDVIETSPKHRWRRRERYAIRPILDGILPDTESDWVAVPPPSTEPSTDDGPYLEGGDILVVGDDLLVGRSGYATDSRGIDWLRRHFHGRRSITEVPLTTDAYHLDCALSLPRPGLAIAYPDAFVDGLPPLIRDWDVIEVDRDEQQSMATNVLILDESHIISDERHSRLNDQLRDRGISVTEIAFDGPAVFGGGLRCSHHPLRRVGSR